MPSGLSKRYTRTFLPHLVPRSAPEDDALRPVIWSDGNQQQPRVRAWTPTESVGSACGVRCAARAGARRRRGKHGHRVRAPAVPASERDEAREG